MRRRIPIPVLLPALLAAVVVSAVLSIGLGSEDLPLPAVWDVVSGADRESSTAVIVRDLRAPRAVLAVVVGAGLALAGAAIQALVRNPLADPYLLGVSSGASVGATAVITSGALGALGGWALSGGALLGALAATLLVFGITMAQGGMDPLRLVLTGVVMSAAFSAIASYLVLRSDNRGAQGVLFWLLGSLSGSTWSDLWAPLVAVTLGVLGMAAAASWMDALATGDESARSLGVPVDGLRRVLFVGSSVLVGIVVAVSGAIGFVGLVVPHLARLLVGAAHRRVLPVAALLGALFLLWVDVLARVAVRPVEMPLGVVTGILGAPVFLLLLGRRRYHYAGSA